MKRVCLILHSFLFLAHLTDFFSAPGKVSKPLLFDFEGAIIKGFSEPAFRTLMLGFCSSLKRIAKELLLIEPPLETNKHTKKRFSSF